MYIGCGKELPITQPEETQVQIQEEKTEPEDTQTVETEPEEETVQPEKEETEPEEREVVIETVDIENVSSTEFATLLKMGWNLGNKLDANTIGGLDSETCWG